MKEVLPDTILARKKEGFSIPMKNWLRRELQPLMRTLLSTDRVGRRGLFDPRKSRAWSRTTSPATRTTPTRCSR